MAHPFQPFPSLDEFCQWVRDKGGDVSHMENEWGRYTRFVSPDGENHAIIMELDPDECIGPHAIRNLEARLKMTSPWTIT